ncbi:MAG: tyrosine-type recombinase/integrase [Deltaproteobacteria bacterium]|nr:tyrosine-type recombinase/integrase [Deltaproteobacteria bacterium]
MTERRYRGHWYVDFWFEGSDGTRERIRKKSPVQTKRGAEEYERQLRTQLLAPKNKEIQRIKFGDFSRQFLEVFVPTKKASVQTAYESSIRVHLVPAFGATWMDEINAKRIEFFAAKLSASLAAKRAVTGRKGNGKKTVRNTVGVLSKMLHVAKRWGHLDVLPEIVFGNVPPGPIRFLSEDESNRLLDAAGPYWYGPILWGLKTGCRQGEIWALERDQIDLQRARVRIDRAVWRKHVGLPKHDKIRDVDLPPNLVAFLKEHLRVVPLSSRIVFPKTGKGSQIRQERKASTGLTRACERAGIEPIGWHVLRHTYASRLVMRGVPLNVVQELLGHADIRETMRYAHLAPNAKREAVKVLDEGEEKFGHQLGTGTQDV